MSEITIDVEYVRVRLLEAIRMYIDDPNSFTEGYLMGCKHIAGWIYGDAHIKDLCHLTAQNLLFPEVKP